MLCSLCRKREAVYDITDLASNPAATYVCDACLDAAVPGTDVCPTCGWTVADYRRTGLFGCADCYRAFLPLTLRETLRLQGKTQHEGKQPMRLLYRLIERRDKLKAQAEACLRRGESREAKRLGEEIARLNRMIDGES